MLRKAGWGRVLRDAALTQELQALERGFDGMALVSHLQMSRAIGVIGMKLVETGFNRRLRRLNARNELRAIRFQNGCLVETLPAINSIHVPNKLVRDKPGVNELTFAAAGRGLIRALNN